MEGERSTECTPVFVTRQKRSNIRKRTLENDNSPCELDDSTGLSVQDLLGAQKLRRRPYGVSIDDLAASRTSGKEHSPAVDPDLLKLQTGGMVSLRTAKAMAALPSLESGGQHIDIGTEFSAETQRRDEDYDMMKFIEDEITKRKIRTDVVPHPVPLEERKITRSEDALLVVAEKYQRDSSKKSEEMLSHQMLSGIPEVDLGIEAKIKNIEATEEAKRRLMQKYRENSPDNRQTSKTATESNPVNYVQHVRYNLDHYKEQAEAKPDQVPRPKTDTVKSSVEQDDLKLFPSANALIGTEKPSDGVYFDRFKKRFMEKMDKEKKSRRGE